MVIGSVSSYNLHTMKIDFDRLVRDLQYYLVHSKTPQVLNLSTSN